MGKGSLKQQDTVLFISAEGNDRYARERFPCSCFALPSAPSTAWTYYLPFWLSLVPLWCLGSWAQGKATFLGPVPMLGCQFLWGTSVSKIGGGVVMVFLAVHEFWVASATLWGRRVVQILQVLCVQSVGLLFQQALFGNKSGVFTHHCKAGHETTVIINP